MLEYTKVYPIPFSLFFFLFMNLLAYEKSSPMMVVIVVVVVIVAVVIVAVVVVEVVVEDVRYGQIDTQRVSFEKVCVSVDCV